MYINSIVPPFPAGNMVNTSRLRQSRNQDGRSLRISAICQGKEMNCWWLTKKETIKEIYPKTLISERIDGSHAKTFNVLKFPITIKRILLSVQ